MNLEDIKMKYKGFYYYQTNMFANINISFYFNMKNTKENRVKSMILCSYLGQTNAKYKNLKKINDKCRELYSADYNVYTTNIGNRSFIKFSFSMIDHKVIGDNYFKEAIDFFKDIMFKPNFKNNKLDTELFEKIKKTICDDEKESNYEPRKMQFRLFLKSIIPTSEIVTTNIEDLNDLNKIISKIKEEDIIEFYYEIINNFSRGFAFGNLSNEEINYIAKCFNFKESYFYHDYFKKEIIESGNKIIKSKDTSQSYLYVVYDILDYKEENIYIYNAILSLLNSSMTGLVLTVLREELGLVYSASADLYELRGFMYIKANIDKKNKDKCLDGIREIFKRLHDKEIINKLLTYYIERVNQIVYVNKESFSFYLNNLKYYVFEECMPEDKEVELINKLTVDDIIKYVNKLEEKYIFYYQGDKDEK